ncbi:cache domain-containing protein [Marichromatium gracile]|uniref:Cache domain-containing protein n=1 Tax=Marichromatium gracile TaxID=1048 RepID=A0A4V2WAL7_MARGR|nr:MULTISPECIES: cache domain-containing protein [Marichromatium]MBO8086697.1 cache domain-containing protein [Marichromatium sp.]KXX63685.1 histidine kinase [Marichromatium gracile]MBK1707802.1 histidine kinase [Marichromatium gracile]MCF1184318.1 cache domain-containing protein [Marichromatium gracile]RNE92083.1 histidine kinase [Marichromatium sp. AB31]
MTRTLFAGSLALALLTPQVFAATPDMATPEEAKALSEQAHEAVESQGAEAAFAAFAAEDGGFRDRDLYVFCMDLEGEMLAHPLKPELVGKNLIDFDKYGDTLFRDMIETVKDSGEGWVDYRWPYPGSDEIRDKATYVIGNDGGFFCGVGAYK